MNDRSRLPKWAQAEMDRLEHDLAFWKGVVEMQAGESDTLVRHDVDTDQGLAPGARVVFGVEYTTAANGYRFGSGIEARWDAVSRTLEVHSSDVLAILPRASNAFRVRKVEWP